MTYIYGLNILDDKLRGRASTGERLETEPFNWYGTKGIPRSYESYRGWRRNQMREFRRAQLWAKRKATL